LDDLGNAPGELLHPHRPRAHAVVARDSAGRRIELRLQVEPLGGNADGNTLVIARRPEPAADIETGEAGMRAILEGLPAAVCVINAAGLVTTTNAAGRALWGESPLHAVVEGIPETQTLYDLYYQALRQQRPVIARTVSVIALDGTHRVVLTTALPYFDPQGRLAGTVATALDITHARQLQAEREELESALRN